jgi:hypothetical protein
VTTSVATRIRSLGLSKVLTGEGEAVVHRLDGVTEAILAVQVNERVEELEAAGVGAVVVGAASGEPIARVRLSLIDACELLRIRREEGR